MRKNTATGAAPAKKPTQSQKERILLDELAKLKTTFSDLSADFCGKLNQVVTASTS